MNKLIVNITGMLTRHKALEISFRVATWSSIVAVDLDVRRKQDHGGLFFRCEMLKLFSFEFNIYDQRHWDSLKGCYLEPEK
jgi:hypothetical protein